MQYSRMLRLACEGRVRRNRHCHAFPLKAEAPGFADYLRSERAVPQITIYTYRRHLKEFADHLSQAGVASLGELSPALLASFIIDRAPRMAPRTRRDLCGHLRVFLRFCHREGVTSRDLSVAVGMSQVYRLNDVPRAITWDEVRCMLDAVERRTIRGRRDYAILLLLVTYGLRANEVAKLTLDDVDWKRERLQVLSRKAGHATAYPLAGVVAEALIDYLKRGRPETSDRHLFFRALAPQMPITSATVSSSVALYLQKAGIKVHKGGSHTLRHTCVQRLIDAEFPLKTRGQDHPWLARRNPPGSIQKLLSLLYARWLSVTGQRYENHCFQELLGSVPQSVRAIQAGPESQVSCRSRGAAPLRSLPPCQPDSWLASNRQRLDR